MAKPIGDTPELECKEASEFLNHMLDPPKKNKKN